MKRWKLTTSVVALTITPMVARHIDVSVGVSSFLLAVSMLIWGLLDNAEN